MSNSLFYLALVLWSLSPAISVFADQYDDCINGCKLNLAPCIDQARLNAGNIQEEQDLIAACEKSKADCRKACSDAESQSEPPPQEQPQNQTQDLLQGR